MRSIPRTARASVVAATLALASGGLTAAAYTADAAPHKPVGLTTHTILKGSVHGWSSPDDLTRVGNSLFVAFQNGVPSTGGAKGTPQSSTIVKLDLAGRIEHTWRLTGKCDGLTADPDSGRVVATVNEDGNSSVYLLPARANGPARHYAFDAAPLPHGGGTDSITIYHGRVYLVASAPKSGGPAVYQVTFRSGVAHLAAAPFYDSSTATVANAGAKSRQVHLALTDPDSSTVVPAQSPRFAGDFMLDAQGDKQAVFASHLGNAYQRLQVLNLSQAVDDTAFATGRHGRLVATDAKANSVVVITGTFGNGTAYASVSPANANSAGPNPAPNYLGTINLTTGQIKRAATSGTTLTPQGPHLHSLTPLHTGPTTFRKRRAGLCKRCRPETESCR